jgi:pimeloyl-ACP methyl ester carboxylesterase
VERSPERAVTALLLILLLLVTSSAAAAPGHDGDPRLFSAEVSGEGPAMILIPGLASSGAVWDETVAHYREHYTCHVLTLAGFAGAPPSGRVPFLEAVRDDLIAYIKDEGLEKPVLVGHSLGGFLSLWVAATEPGLVGQLVIVDSLPFLGAAQAPTATPETMKPQAEAMLTMMQGMTQDQFRRQQAQILPTMITDPEDVATALATGGASDPATVARAMYELLTTDLRTHVAHITAPTLVIGTWVAYEAYATREQVAQNFAAQYDAMPDARVTLSDTARHFVMYDDLPGMLREMDAFLNTLGENR